MKNSFFDDDGYYFKGPYLQYLILRLISKLTLGKIKRIEKKKEVLYKAVEKSRYIK